MKAIVVVPTYNEAENLPLLAEKIMRATGDLHLLIVDDNSPDGTGRLGEELAREHPGRIFVLHREKKQGLGPAYVEGMTFALRQGYDVIQQMDGDLSHDPDRLPHFLEQISGCDIVLGSRYLNQTTVKNWGLRRLVLSRMGTLYVKLLTGMPFSDCTGGFNCWRREALEAIDLQGTFANGYLFLIELKYLAFLAGLRVTETQIVFTGRGLGDSKMNWRIVWEAIWGVIRLRLKYRRR